jgi:hypothetical protein
MGWDGQQVNESHPRITPASKKRSLGTLKPQQCKKQVPVRLRSGQAFDFAALRSD